MTRASNATYQARIQEIEAILHKQQTTIDSSSKATYEKLSTMENQFKRLDDFDTKLIDVGSQLDQVTKRQTTQSILLQSIKTDTHEQIKAMETTLVNSYTSQSKMATAMMTMQERIEKITELMQKLTNRLDLEVSPKGHDNHYDTFASENPDPDDPPATQPVHPTKSTICASHSSSSGSFTDPCYHSPQKKKVRSPQEGKDSTQHSEMLLCHSDDDSGDNTTITSITNKPTARKKINKRLFSQKESQTSLAAIFNKKASKTGGKQANKALLGTHYKSQSDPDGAASI